MEMKLPGTKSEKFTPREVVLFLKALENVVLFAAGSCRKFEPALFWWNGNRLCLPIEKSSVNKFLIA